MREVRLPLPFLFMPQHYIFPTLIITDEAQCKIQLEYIFHVILFACTVLHLKPDVDN